MVEDAFAALTYENLKDIICCPGGVELKGKDFKGDIGKIVSWTEGMIRDGMEGLIHYTDGAPVGFVQYMPTDKAPMPIVGPGTCTLMCFHWKGEDDSKHLDMEYRLLEEALEISRVVYEGMAVLAWDHPIHFPVSMMDELGFNTVDTQDHLHLMWKPFDDDAVPPSLVDHTYDPMRSSSRLIIEQGYSNRCPYSISHAQSIKDMVLDIGDERIDHILHTIDTRDESIRYAVVPWNWDWLYIDGERIDTFSTSTREIKEMVLESLDQ